MAVNILYHKSNNRLEEEFVLINNAKKDPNYFAPLYKEYYEQIYRYINRRMDNEELAFDVTSQVFIKALKNIQNYEFKGVPFSSWLYRIAKSEVYQVFRDRKNTRTITIENIDLFDIVEEFEDEINQKNKSIISNCLKELNSNDLNLIELRFFEKRSFKEIGEILKLTENNAKVKTFRALKRLKRLFNTKLLK